MVTLKRTSTLIFLIILLSVSCSYNRELVVINDGNNVYHRDDCQFVKKANKDDLILIAQNLEGTVRAHLRPCQTCNPPDNREYIMIVVEEIEDEILKLVEQYKTIPEDLLVEAKGLEGLINSTIPAREVVLKEIETLIGKINKIFETYGFDRTITTKEYL